jgi:DNA-binding phage protein
MAEEFKEDPAYALELINAILEDREEGELLIALRQMTKALGGVQSVAQKATLNPIQSYRTIPNRATRNSAASRPSSRSWASI